MQVTFNIKSRQYTIWAMITNFKVKIRLTNGDYREKKEYR